VWPDFPLAQARPPEEYASSVEAYWNSPIESARVAAAASPTSGFHTLSVAKVGRLHLPIPPLAEQHRIAAKVERRLSIIDEAEAVVAANLKRADRLRQAILKRAFEGKLVPQDPNDEPASVVLERIRAEREASGKTRSNARGRGRAKSGQSALDLGV
jgi:type I restriction enzyme, S subunit